MKITIFALLFLALTSASQNQPVGVLTDFLDHLMQGVTDEQLAHDSLKDTEMAECEDEFAYRNLAIQDGNDAYTRSSSHYDQCEGSLAEAQADLQQIALNIAEVESTKVTLTRRREQQHENFLIVQQQLTEAIDAVEACFPFIDKMEQQSSFLEISKNMLSTFKTVSKTGNGASMAGVLTAMATLSTKYDQAKVAEVRRLMEQLLSELRDSRSLSLQVETSQKSVYESAIIEYDSILATLETQQVQLEDYSYSMQACLDQEEWIMSSAENKVTNNQNLLEYAQTMCQAFLDEYTKATEYRNNELQLMGEVKEFIIDEAARFEDQQDVEEEGVFDQYKSEWEAAEQERIAEEQSGQSLNEMFVQLKQKIQVQKESKSQVQHQKVTKQQNLRRK